MVASEGPNRRKIASSRSRRPSEIRALKKPVFPPITRINKGVRTVRNKSLVHCVHVVHNVDMQGTAPQEPLVGVVNFRATKRMVDAVEEHRLLRKLPRASHAARELFESFLGGAELLRLASEFRRLGGDAEAALRQAITQLEETALREPVSPPR